MNRIAQLIRLTPLALALLPLNSWADASSDIAELKARLAQLEQQVKEAAAKPAPVAAPAAASTGLQVGDTKFGFKGYVKLDAISSQFSEGEVGRTVGRDFYVPNQIPVFGAAGTGATAGTNGKSRNFFDLHAKQTRFIVTTETPTGGANALKGHIEMDFLSSTQGDERISNGYSPELRQAFITYGKWMAQTLSVPPMAPCSAASRKYATPQGRGSSPWKTARRWLAAQVQMRPQRPLLSKPMTMSFRTWSLATRTKVTLVMSQRPLLFAS